jgi:hypothetical protein
MCVVKVLGKLSDRFYHSVVDDVGSLFIWTKIMRVTFIVSQFYIIY